MENSPIQKVSFEGIGCFFVKRDDLLHPYLNGNKARKFYYLLKTKLPKKIVSYGSMQSNAMAALSYLAKIKGVKFEYYCRINENVLKEPIGNLKFALENKMVLKNLDEFDYIDEDLNLLSRLVWLDDILIVPEGGRFKEAEIGIKKLAEEIILWAEKNGVEPDIFLPSGTGTSALFLQKYLPFKVYTTNCIGNSDYLKKQFLALEENKHPYIIEPLERFSFAKPNKKLLDIYNRLKIQTGIEFDLIYDTVAFKTILENKNRFSTLLYIHQGGILGNVSMLKRYKAKFDKIR